mgnify:CR=1 FL=1
MKLMNCMPKGVYSSGLFAVVAGLVLLNGGPADCQQAVAIDPVVEYNRAVAAVQAKKWDEGLKAVNAVISEYGSEGLSDYGPVFGHFYFIKGLALQGKEDLGGAIEAFKACYQKYSNKYLADLSDKKKQGLLPNNFINAAHVQWANTEMKMEKYTVARDLYEKILVEAKADPSVSLIYVAVNLGRCYLKAGDLQKGFDFMERPLSNEALSDGLHETVFMVIAEDWSTKVEYPEVRAFLQEYATTVDLDPFEERYERNPRFLYLAQLALSQQDPVRALAWYERMVNPTLLRPDYERRYEQLENRVVPEALEAKKNEALDELAKNKKRLGTDYIQILNGVGSIHFMMQNFGGSYVAFSQLSDIAGPKHSLRPVFLHNAVVSAAQTNQWKSAYHYGKQFLKEFPTHELKPGVARVLVEILFIREEYKDAYEISGEVRTDMTEGEAMREIPDFVRGASAFQLGHVEEAETELSKYFDVYPNGERLEMAQFFLGLSKVRLSKWAEAAELLNDFLKKYPGSVLVPTVLYQCAMSEFMLDEMDAALAKVDRVVTEYPGHEVSAASWNLKGDILATIGSEFVDIELCYLSGRDGGKELGQPETVAYALWQLVIQTGDAEQWEKADAHYIEFRDNHSESGYRHDMLVAALPVLVEQGRKEEGLEKLREVVWKNREDPESSVLAEIFGSYVAFMEDEFDRDFLLEQMSAFQEERGVTPCLRGWAAVAKADALEAREASQELVDKEFYMLEADFDPALQSNYPIVRLARWISHSRKRPEEAQGLYEYILENRPGTPNFEYCLIDTAEIQAQSSDAAQREEAMDKFARVMAEVPNEELQEKAILGMARIRTKEKRYEEAKALWGKYLENRSWAISRPEANYRLAECYESEGNLGDALKVYVSIYANFPGHLDWSTRAYIRTALITKSRGDDLKALKVLQDMLKRMGHHDHVGVEKGKELFLTWREEFQATAASEEQ